MDSWAMAADVAIDSFQTRVTRQWSLLYTFLSIEDYLLLEHASNDMSALPAVSLWGQGMIEHKEQAENTEKTLLLHRASLISRQENSARAQLFTASLS